jgi:hypothetical protein
MAVRTNKAAARPVERAAGGVPVSSVVSFACELLAVVLLTLVLLPILALVVAALKLP